MRSEGPTTEVFFYYGIYLIFSIHSNINILINVLCFLLSLKMCLIPIMHNFPHYSYFILLS